MQRNYKAIFARPGLSVSHFFAGSAWASISPTIPPMLQSRSLIRAAIAGEHRSVVNLRAILQKLESGCHVHYLQPSVRCRRGEAFTFEGELQALQQALASNDRTKEEDGYTDGQTKAA